MALSNDNQKTLGLTYFPEQYSITDRRAPYGISAGCVVYRKAPELQVLLLVRTDDTEPLYHLPKGTLHVGESLEEAAVRETVEEAGVDAKLVTYLGGYTPTLHIKTFSFEKTVHYFAAQYVDELGEMDGEHEAKVWLGIEEAIEKLKATTYKKEYIFVERLQRFLEGESLPV